MTPADDNATQMIRRLRSYESEELITLMEVAFKDSIEQDRLDAAEVRTVLRKMHTSVYRLLARAMGMRMEFYVAEVDDRIASGIVLSITKDEVHVANLMTNPEYRRRGLARGLLHLAFSRARELGLKRLSLNAKAGNVNAVHLYASEGFEVAYHSGSFESDSIIDRARSSSSDLALFKVSRIALQDIDAMLDDCFPASHLEVEGRQRFAKDFVPSRATRFFAGRLGGQSINTYAFRVNGQKKPRGFIQASQSRIEDRIRLSSPILLEEDNDLLSEIIPRIIEIETGHRGLTTASINCSLHRTDAVSRIEKLGFKKVRENLSMIKRL